MSVVVAVLTLRVTRSCGCAGRDSRAWQSSLQALHRKKHIFACREVAGRSSKPLTADIKAKHPNHSLPPGLLRARQVKTVGTKASAAVFALGLTAAWFQGIKMPSPGQWSAAGLASFVCLGAIVLGVAVTKDKAQIEIHGGRLYIQWGAPSTGPPLAEGAIQVRLTGDGRGNGAFAVMHIPMGTYLGDYEGEMLDETSYWARYPSGVADYCIKVDREWTIDGRERATDTSKFSPCHMNHSGSKQNVVGEELLLDYGPNYWKTREDQVID